jgi:hypothetical protein
MSNRQASIAAIISAVVSVDMSLASSASSWILTLLLERMYG